MVKINWKNYLGAAAILVLVLGGGGSLARAATIEKIEIESGSKKIKIIGSCLDQNAAVHIFSATSSESFYTAGSLCRDNKFYFQDDLGYWKLPPGAYRVRVVDENSPLTHLAPEETFSIENAPPETQTNSITTETPYQTLGDGAGQASSHSEVDLAQVDKEAGLADAPGFLSRIINAIADWFKSAIVMIKELVAEKITTPKICLGETCLMESQLKELLGKNQISSISTEK